MAASKKNKTKTKTDFQRSSRCRQPQPQPLPNPPPDRQLVFHRFSPLGALHPPAHGCDKKKAGCGPARKNAHAFSLFSFVLALIFRPSSSSLLSLLRYSNPKHNIHAHFSSFFVGSFVPSLIVAGGTLIYNRGVHTSRMASTQRTLHREGETRRHGSYSERLLVLHKHKVREPRTWVVSVRRFPSTFFVLLS